MNEGSHKQSEHGKLPAAEDSNDELAIDFDCRIKIAPDAKKYLSVSMDKKLARRYILTKTNCQKGNDEALQISPDEFPNDDDVSTFLRDRARSPKLENQIKKKRGTGAAASSHTFTLKTPRGPQVYAKRDVAKADNKTVRLTAQNKNAEEININSNKNKQTYKMLRFATKRS